MCKLLQSQMPPRYFIVNVFADQKGKLFSSQLVHPDMEVAAIEAEDFADDYQFSLINMGVNALDLREMFSEAYHERMAKEQEQDRRIKGKNHDG